MPQLWGIRLYRLPHLQVAGLRRGWMELTLAVLIACVIHEGGHYLAARFF